MSAQLPLVLRTLAERLHYQCRGPRRVVRLDVFSVDLSEWKLAFTHRTPCFWIHAPEMLNLPALDLAEEIRDAVRQETWQNEPVLVVMDGAAEELKTQLVRPYAQLAGAFTQFVVLGEEEQRQVADAPSPTRVLLDLILRQMARAQLAPYQTGRPVTDSRFFGRKRYLNKILHHPKINYLITGERRIGKTSLLHEILRLLDVQDPPGEGETRRLYVDCSVIKSEDDFYREIVSRLRKSELKRLLGSQEQRFKAKMFDYFADQNGGTITYLLDEIDGLLAQLGRDQKLFQVLRAVSMKDGVARFIIAGFRDVRRAMEDETTPFFHLGERVTLEALDRNEVAAMIETPLDHLRIKLQGREELVQRIFRETAGMPHLMQYYCQTLIEHLDHAAPPGDTLSVASLQAVYDNPNLHDVVVGHFMRNAPPLERAVVFALLIAQQTRPGAPLSHKEIDQQLRVHGLNIDFVALNEACQNLVYSSVLRKQGKLFGFSIPLFARMLQENYASEFILETTRAELTLM